MERAVPITFTNEGKTFNGVFQAVVGAAATAYETWHLMIDNFYHGQLHYSQMEGRWLFHSNSGKFDHLSTYFEAYMIGWFQ